MKRNVLYLTLAVSVTAFSLLTVNGQKIDTCDEGYKVEAVANEKQNTYDEGYGVKVEEVTNEKQDNLLTEVQEHIHNYLEVPEYSVKASCSNEGSVTYKCECGDSYTKKLSKKEHNYECISKTDATCLKNGSAEYKCDCGAYYTKELNKLGHSYKCIDSKESTTSSEGYKKYQCTRCKHEYTETLKVKPSNTVSSGNKISLRKKNLCSVPSSISKGSLNDGQYALAMEILEVLRTSNSETVELKTLYHGSADNVREVFNVLSNHVGAEVSYKSISSCSEDGKIYAGKKNEYVKVKVAPLTTKRNIDRKNELVNLTYDALSKAGVKNGMSEKDAVLKINNWICKHMTYKLNGADAVTGFKTGKGQCATYASMFKEMCNAAGIQCQISMGDAGGPHAWNRVRVGGVWYYVDSTWADSANGSKYVLSKTLWSTHTLD